MFIRYKTFFDWRKPLNNDGSVLTFANQVLFFHSLRWPSLCLILYSQNISAYSGKTYGEGSQHGLNVEFDFRRFISAVDQLMRSKRVIESGRKRGGHMAPDDL